MTRSQRGPCPGNGPLPLASTSSASGCVWARALTQPGYASADDEEQLRRIYDDLEPRLSIKTEEMEVTSIFAGVGMVLFLVGAAFSILWFGRVP